jgi:hypothetical protein
MLSKCKMTFWHRNQNSGKHLRVENEYLISMFLMVPFPGGGINELQEFSLGSRKTLLMKKHFF